MKISEANLLNHFFSLRNVWCHPSWNCYPNLSQIKRQLIACVSEDISNWDPTIPPRLLASCRNLGKAEWEDLVAVMVLWLSLRGVCGGIRWLVLGHLLCWWIFCAQVKPLCLSPAPLLFFKQVASPLKITWPLISHWNAKSPVEMEAYVGRHVKAQITILIIGPNMK